MALLLGFAAAQQNQPEQCGSKEVNASSTPFRLNGTFTFDAVPAPRLVPYPASLRTSAAYLPLGSCSISVDDESLLPLAKLLSAEVLAATDGTVNLAVTKGASAPGPSAPGADCVSAGCALLPPTCLPTQPSEILLSLSHKLSGESYSLVSTSKSVTLVAGTYAGMVSATATLLQAIERSGNYDAVPRTGHNCTTAPEWRLPALNIQDTPELPYRGIMVDAARAYLPLSALKGFVTLCRLYKLNYLHIHLTDDNAFTFPSTAYPELSNGSSWKYTLQELQELNDFANARNVEIVGEMDVRLSR
jgi:hypothetical protein